MPVQGIVHPDVYARWLTSPQPFGSGAPAMFRQGEAALAVEPAVEQEPGGTTVSAQTSTQVARVLIADDQTLFRSGLARLLTEDKRVSVVGQAVDGLDAVKQASAHNPDVVLMDLKMPNLDGVEATRKIVAEHPDMRVLILTTFDADSFVLQALPLHDILLIAWIALQPRHPCQGREGRALVLGIAGMQRGKPALGGGIGWLCR